MISQFLLEAVNKSDSLKYFYKDSSFWLKEYTDSFKNNFETAAALAEEQATVAEAVSEFITSSCSTGATCSPIEIPEYIPDETLSEEENLQKSVDEAVNEPLSIEGLQVSTPAEIDDRLNSLFEDVTQEAESEETEEKPKPKSPLEDFATVPRTQLNQVLGDSMVSSVNGFFVEIDACMSVERCVESLEGSTGCYQ